MNDVTKRFTSDTDQYFAQAEERNQQYLSFMLGGETFAMDILGIKEIIECGKLTKVPRMPAYIQGVINLRGMVMPVISLSLRLGKKSEIARNASIVVIQVASGEADTTEQYNIGVIVDAVNGVVEIAPVTIEPPPPFGTCIHSDFIEGIGKVNDQFLILLNLKQVLRVDDIAARSNEMHQELAAA